MKKPLKSWLITAPICGMRTIIVKLKIDLCKLVGLSWWLELNIAMPRMAVPPLPPLEINKYIWHSAFAEEGVFFSVDS